MIDLSRIKLGVSPIGGAIYLFRHGVDPGLALDRRAAEADVMAAVVGHLMHEAPHGSEKDVWFGERGFRVRVEPLSSAVGPEGSQSGLDPDCAALVSRGLLEPVVGHSVGSDSPLLSPASAPAGVGTFFRGEA